MTGWGTNTCLSSDIPFTAATERATRSNLSVCIATVGTPYCASIVIACAATAGAQVLQWPTPTIAACPFARISSHVAGSSCRYTLEIGFITVRTPGMCSANHACTCPRKTSESSKRQSTRYTVFPSSMSSRGASSLRVTLGGKPTGFRTVSFFAIAILLSRVDRLRDACASPLVRADHSTRLGQVKSTSPFVTPPAGNALQCPPCLARRRLIGLLPCRAPHHSFADRRQRMELDGQVAIVTGAGRGIGRATALELARLGADIVVAELDPSGADHTAGLVKGLGRRASVAPTDVTKPGDLKAMVERTRAEFGRIDILVNN